jgi:hypothetical protein
MSFCGRPLHTSSRSTDTITCVVVLGLGGGGGVIVSDCP